MKVAGIFAGIGGFELGLSRAGHHTVLTCENDSAAKAILSAHLDAPNHDDVRTLKSLPQGVDLLCAGFPCQDLSQAGMTKGINGTRSGLVGEVFRVLGKNRVPWVLIENVSFMRHLHGGHGLRVIVEAIEGLRYRWAYRVVNSLAFLPQRRERIFLLASQDGDPADVLFSDEVIAPKQETRMGHIAHGFYWTEGIRGLGWAPDAIPTLKNGSTVGIPSSPSILMPTGEVIRPDIRDAERLQGFDADWTKPATEAKRSGFRWSLVGNAVTVPVAEWLGRRLACPGKHDEMRDRPLPPDSKWPIAARFDGMKRLQVTVSKEPFWQPRPHMHDFLRYPGTLLSERATAGFQERINRSSLRFPVGFREAIAAHLARMRSTDPDDHRRRSSDWKAESLAAE
jgi:DNA (cytosine-5)-methyltransferase 1